MNKELQRYQTFFDFIRKRHFRKAREIEEENPTLIERRSREKERYFRGLPMKIKENFLLYAVFYRPHSPKTANIKK